MKSFKMRIMAQIILIGTFACGDAAAAMWTQKSSMDLPLCVETVWEFTGNPTSPGPWIAGVGGDWSYSFAMDYDATDPVKYIFDISFFSHVTNPHTGETKGGYWDPAPISFSATENTYKEYSGGPFTHEPGPHYDMFSYSIKMINADTASEKITLTLEGEHVPAPGGSFTWQHRPFIFRLASPPTQNAVGYPYWVKRDEYSVTKN